MSVFISSPELLPLPAGFVDFQLSAVDHAFQVEFVCLVSFFLFHLHSEDLCWARTRACMHQFCLIVLEFSQ